jgi:hypothetical protein
VVAGIPAYLARLTLVVLACGGVFGLSAGLSARADELRCQNETNVVVHSLNYSDAQTACAGASDAIRFLQALGLVTTGQINLRIVDELPASESSSRSGCFIASERCAYLLTFAKIEERGTPFDLPISRTLYQHMAAHEVAHVIAANNFDIPVPRIEAQEYIAYVTMLATMAPSYRELLLAQYPGSGFVTEMEINTTMYLFDPLRFGIQAYRHFLKAENGKVFVQRILTGQALVAGDGN